MSKKETVNRLCEIRTEIKTLVEEAKQLIQKEGTTTEKERARSYFIPQILMALDNDHDYLGGTMFTMQDVENSISEQGTDDEIEDD